MTEREAAINRDLRVLDDAHRLGRISRAEYRNRRRRVLQSPDDGGDAVTARKALVQPAAITMPRGLHALAAGADDDAGRSLASLLSMRPALTWKPLLASFLGISLLAAMIWWLLLHH